MAYIALADVKVYLNIPVGTTVDDALLTALIARGTAIMDALSTRHFEGVTATRTFNLPEGRLLELDYDLLAVTTLTNGDGTAIQSAEYVLVPPNVKPAYAIKLRDYSAVMWLPSAGSPMGTENCISVAGSWGYATTAPDDIVHYTARLVSWLYRQRANQAQADMPVMSLNGTMLIPGGLPRDIVQGLASYRRLL
jgi:hypothetical protein